MNLYSDLTKALHYQYVHWQGRPEDKVRRDSIIGPCRDGGEERWGTAAYDHDRTHHCKVEFDRQVPGYKLIDGSCAAPLAPWRAIASDVLARLDAIDRGVADHVLAGEATRGMPLPWFELASTYTSVERVWLSDDGIVERRTQAAGAECTVEFRDGLLEKWGECREEGNKDG